MILLANDEIIKILGERIKENRIERGYSQKEFAIKCGLSQHTLSNIETGKTFSIDNLLNILRFFNMLDNVNMLIPNVEPNPYDVIKGIKNRKRKKRV